MSNDNAEVPNQPLREYATEGAFLLALTRRHIQLIQALALNDRSFASAHWIGAMNGLTRRGLAYHACDFFGRKGDRYSEARRVWGAFGISDRKLAGIARLTKAGWLVYDLLAEAGMVEVIDRRSALRRNVAA